MSNLFVRHLEDVPYNVSRKSLYSPLELYAGFDPEESGTIENCYDNIVYKHYISSGKQADNEDEALARSLHDHYILMALDSFLSKRNPKLNIGIMGGHSMLRTDSTYRLIAEISKKLTELGFMMLSGGGPGAMEATHLGAWMAGRTEKDLDDAISILSAAPSYKDKEWLSSSFNVMRRYPQNRYVSLGIPTWLYGHEPSTAFATHIAKLFENSIREDGLLKLAFGGIIYTPGSAGTLQEIFQDAAQNHYISFGFSSPMVFLGRRFWTEDIPVYPFLEKLMETGRYSNLLLSIHDNPDDIVSDLMEFRDSE